MTEHEEWINCKKNTSGADKYETTINMDIVRKKKKCQVMIFDKESASAVQNCAALQELSVFQKVVNWQVGS